MRGFTYTEVLLIVALTSLLGMMSVPFYGNFVLRSNMQVTKDKLISAIRKAQMYSITSKNGGGWGICKSSTSVMRIYRGSCSTPTLKEDYTIPANITVNNLTDTSFSALRGEPSSALNINIVSSLSTITISLNTVGGMDY